MRLQLLLGKMALAVFVLAVCPTVRADLSAGLVAYYPFSGNANDASGNEHNGSVHGATLTTDRFGNPNSAYHFDGLNDYVRVPDDPQLDGMSALTLSVWVKINSVDRDTEVLNKWVAGDSPLDGAYAMGIDAGEQTAFQYCTDHDYVIKISKVALGIGSWHHIAGVYTGTQASIYIDGSLVALSRNDPDVTGPLHRISEDLLIGCGNLRGILTSFFQGSIDDVRIYNRALTDSEILDLFGVPAPVYRFWSPVFSRHFYTISESEKNKLITYYPAVWTYEQVAYYAYADDSQPGVAPIYRFWSGTLNAHFYTMSQAERDKLINLYPHVWAYEGVAFYAHAEGSQPSGTRAVYRFWSGTLGCHFYTMSETERDKLMTLYSYVWTYEGVVWYVEIGL
jgi:hypothetical protein